MAAMAVGIITDPITVDIRDRLRWRWAIGLTTLVVPDIGRATGITSGSLDIGFIGTGRKSGDAATTLYADIDRATKERRLSSRRGRIWRLRNSPACQREIALP
jgi:hypothetical protein